MTQFTNSQVALVAGSYSASSILGWELGKQVQQNTHYLEDKYKPESDVGKFTAETLQNSFSAVCGVLVGVFSFGTAMTLSRSLGFL